MHSHVCVLHTRSIQCNFAHTGKLGDDQWQLMESVAQAYLNIGDNDAAGEYVHVVISLYLIT